MHFPIFLKLHVQSIIFPKFLHEIEAAATWFVMERGRRKGQQNSRISVRAQVKLVYPGRNLSDSSKSLDYWQIKGTWRCRQSRFLFPDSSRKDRSDSASRVAQRRTMGKKIGLSMHPRNFISSFIYFHCLHYLHINTWLHCYFIIYITIQIYHTK